MPVMPIVGQEQMHDTTCYYRMYLGLDIFCVTQNTTQRTALGLIFHTAWHGITYNLHFMVPSSSDQSEKLHDFTRAYVFQSIACGKESVWTEFCVASVALNVGFRKAYRLGQGSCSVQINWVSSARQYQSIGRLHVSVCMPSIPISLAKYQSCNLKGIWSRGEKISL